MFVADGMTDRQAAALKADLEQIDHVADVIWYDSFADDSIPQEFLPEDIYDVFHSGTGTLMAIFFDTSTSADETIDAILAIRRTAGQQCFLSSMSAIVADTRRLVEQELFWYVLIAVILSCVVLAVTMDSWIAPALFMVSIGMAIVYNLGTDVFRSSISFITMSLAAGAGQLAAGVDAIISGNDGNNLNALIDGLNVLGETVSQSGPTLVSGISQLHAGADTLKQGIATAAAGAGQLSAGTDTLASGTQTLQSGAQALTDGVGQVMDGASQLMAGMDEFNKEGIQTLSQLIKNDARGFFDRLRALQDYGAEYTSFSGSAPGTPCSVRFIIRTDSIE